MATVKRAKNKDLEVAFEAFCKCMGKRVARPWSKELGYDVGAWYLQHSGSGTVAIEELNKGGGSSSPITDRRYTPKELLDVLRFAVAAIGVRKGYSRR